MVPALTLHNILEGKTNDSYAKWFNENFPEYQFPLQIVVVDVPPMGWAQPLDNFSNMLELSNYFRLIKAELDSELPLKNFYISRSASAKMALIAGQDDAGVVITGGTYPHPEVVHANIEEIKRLEKEENQLPNWPIIHQFSKMILDPVFHFELEVATSKNTPVLSLIGGNDAETPELAQKLWKELLKVSEENPHRSQFIIEGAGHQVFKRPEKLGPEISDKDPEIKAYQLLFSFLKKYL
jgi:pimeloyl-ACP methyl ester carboxylesterase